MGQKGEVTSSDRRRWISFELAVSFPLSVDAGHGVLLRWVKPGAGGVYGLPCWASRHVGDDISGSSLTLT